VNYPFKIKIKRGGVKSHRSLVELQ